MEGTAALRGAAAQWSLSGDRQLLHLLQDIHQRIISKCNETNKRLEEMSRGLRDASVNLQNVNNKFLALSNTQFVESRVYDDDADVAPPAVQKEPPKVKDLASDLSKLKQSLQILESYHEPLLIVRDSDSDSDSDDNDDRLVLKPKDLYAERPLPHIIGSQAWRTKWHAGLVPDESDSDSSTSKVQDVEVYSEDEEPEPQDYSPARKISTGSSSLQSEAPAPGPPGASPAAVAAELARRLGGGPEIPEREPAYTQPETVVRKLYKPQEPLATTIFPDEPPPLDSSSEDDIFAELHKPRNSDLSPERGLVDALFGPPKVQSNNVYEPPLSVEDSEPEMETPRTAKEQADDSVKKPIGGISLFGTNKHAESIGAAILQRNRRRSSTSDDESNTEEVKVAKEVKPVKEVKEVKKERDIFDDLFAKSEKLNKKNVKTEVVPPKDVTKPKEVKKDVFSDIFDDIDDIFSSDIVNVQVKETKKNEKSLFNDDDDLFAEIPKLKKESDKVVASEKSDLFSDVAPKVDKDKEKTNRLADGIPQVNKSDRIRENKVIKEIKETKSLFDSDSDDGLFTSVTKDLKQNMNKTEEPVEYKLNDDLFDDDEDDGLFARNNNVSKANLEVNRNISKTTDITKSALFDSDDELFKDTKNLNEVKPQLSNQIKNFPENINENNNVTPVNKIEIETGKPHAINEVRSERDVLSKTDEERKYSTIADSINNDLFDDDVPPESSKESMLETSHDSFDDEEPYINKPTNTKNYANENTHLAVAAAICQDSQGNDSDQISDNILGKSQEQTYFKENILRTTRIASDEENTTITSPARDIAIESDDDLFRSKATITKLNENDNQIHETPKATILPETPELFAGSSDIFSDIFDDVPPVFEKPKEPKKSKNVNALFDDDSDDEALFFKKNDVITDEKPDFSPSEERFGIFNDEPPAIDIDFTQKSIKNEVLHKSRKGDDVHATTDQVDDFKPEPVKTDDLIGNIDKNIDHDTTDNTSKEPKKIGKLKPMNFNINVNTLLPGASPKKKQVENTDGQTVSNEELHKTDKIEPKMVKSISFDDPEILDNKISKERAKIQVKRRPSTRRARKEAVRKSAIDFTDSSFDSSNDNSVKDEIKQEKVVKTVYILNDDDIFGSTETNDDNAEHKKKHLNIVDSDEELLKKPEQTTDKELNVSVVTANKQATAERKSFDSVDSDDLFMKPSNLINVAKDEVDTTDIQNVSKSVLETNQNYDLFNAKKVERVKIEELGEQVENISTVDSDDTDNLFKNTHKKSTIDPIKAQNLDSDEELFRNTPKAKNYGKEKQTKSFLNSDDDDDLFKTKNPLIPKKIVEPVSKSNISSDEEDLFRHKGIGTLGKVYNKTQDTSVKEPHSIFDDFPAKSPDNFNTDVFTQSKANTIKKPVKDEHDSVKKAVVKKSILDDLSDEDDLFKSKAKLMNKKDTSLFGDDANDDDLFGSKPVKEIKQDVPVAPPTKEPKAAEPVFVDPLSLFGDED